MEKLTSYRQLKVWQTGMELAREIYQMSTRFPADERYGLTSQIRRAAVSIPANLSEGHARHSTKDFLRHVSITRGSLAELETLLMLARDFQYCNQQQVAPLLNICDEEGRMLRGLEKSLRAKLTT